MRSYKTLLKRGLALVLALVMCLSMLSIAAAADDGENVQDDAAYSGETAGEVSIEPPEETEETKDAETPEETEETEDAETPEETEETEDAETPEETEETEDVEAPEETEETEDAETPEETEDAEAPESPVKKQKAKTASGITHKVTFDLRDGSPLIEIEVPDGELIPAESIPNAESHADGYTFSGWEYINYQYGDRFYNRASYGDIIFCLNPEYRDWDFDTKTVTEDVVIYAKWDAPGVYYAQFETSGGPLVPSQRFTDPNTVTEPNVPGWTVSDWCYALYTIYPDDVLAVLHEWNFGHAENNHRTWPVLLAYSTVYYTIDDNNVMRLYGYGMSEGGSTVDPDPTTEEGNTHYLYIPAGYEAELPIYSNIKRYYKSGNWYVIAPNSWNVQDTPEITKIENEDNVTAEISGVAQNKTGYFVDVTASENAQVGDITEVYVTYTGVNRQNSSRTQRFTDKIIVEITDVGEETLQKDETKLITAKTDVSAIGYDTDTRRAKVGPDSSDVAIVSTNVPDYLGYSQNKLLSYNATGNKDGEATVEYHYYHNTMIKDSTAGKYNGYSMFDSSLHYWVDVVNFTVGNPSTDDPDSIDDLEIKKEVDKDKVTGGDTLVYTITVTNSSSVDKKVTVTDILTSGLNFVSHDGNADEVTIGGEFKDTITWTPTVSAGGSAVLHITCKVNDNAQGGLHNTAKLTMKDGEKESSATTLAAPKKYTVRTYDPDNLLNTYKVVAGQTVTPDSPTRDGHTFLGWATTRGGAVAYQPDTAIKPTGDMDLYAVWQDNGGHGPGTDPEEFNLKVEKRITEVNGAAYTSGVILKDGDKVTYEVKVSNTTKEDLPLYDLVIWDVMDPGLSMTGEPSGSVSGNGGNTDIRYKGSAPAQVEENGNTVTKTAYYWQLTGEFRKDASVTLTYTDTVSYDGHDKITLRNVAYASGYTVAADEPSDVSTPRGAARSTFDPSTLFDPSRDEHKVNGSSGAEGAVSGGGSGAEIEVGGKPYKVTFDPNGGKWGTDGANRTVEVPKADTGDTTVGSKMPANPAGDGSHFTGWNTKQDGSGDTFTKDTPITGNVTVYAQWEEHSFTREDDSAWVTEPDCINDGVASFVCECGEHENRTVEDSRLGHITGKWYDGSTKDSVHTDGCTTAQHSEICDRCGAVLGTADHSYGDWSVDKAATIDADGERHHVCAVCGHVEKEAIPALGKVTITVEFRDGEGNLVKAEKVVVAKDSEYDVTAEAGRLPEGYEADGELSGDPVKGTADSDKTVTVPVKKTETAPEPEARTYTLSYNANGGSGTMESQSNTNTTGSATFTVKANAFTAPEGKVFDAWNTAADGSGTAYAENASITITVDTVLYARWKDAPVIPIPTYTVTYALNGGRSDEQLVYTGLKAGDATPAIANPTRSGYTFRGWDPAVAETVTGDATYTAQWRRNGGGGGGGGVTPTTPPEIEIEDPDVPLASAPGLNSADHFAYIIGYPDGNVRPTGNITRAEVATIFFRLMTDDYRTANWSTTSSFSDVEAGKVWYNNAVATTEKAGLIKGMPDGTFSGERSITRAEFAAIAARFLSNEEVTVKPFDDIAGHWAEQDILRAVQAGWIRGDGDGRFRPDDPITRAEVMTLVNRMLDRVPDKEHMLADMIVWPDNPESEWYYEAVQEATNGHDYERADGVTETWTAMQPVRDWAALETEWAVNGGASGPAEDKDKG